MYKVFFKDKVIYLTDKFKATSLNFHHVNTIKDIKESIYFLNSDKKLLELSLYNSDIEKLQSMFKSLYTMIEAAGGLIKNQKRDLLFIFRKKKWDLPKGKIDEGETPQQAALREVKEETGLSNMEIINLLTHTYHTYFENGKKIIKKTYWYNMKYLGNKTPVGQAEEDISIVKWINSVEIEKIKQNTYNSILDVLTQNIY